MLRQELQYGAKGEKAGLEFRRPDCSEVCATKVEEDVAPSGTESGLAERPKPNTLSVERTAYNLGIMLKS